MEWYMFLLLGAGLGAGLIVTLLPLAVALRYRQKIASGAAGIWRKATTRRRGNTRQPNTNTPALTSPNGSGLREITYRNCKGLWLGPIALVGLIAGGLVLWGIGEILWGMILMGAGLTYVGRELVGIRALNKGLVFSWNRPIGFVNAGFFLPFPVLSGIKEVSRVWVELNFPIRAIFGGKDSGGNESYIEGDLTVTIRAKEDVIENTLTMPSENIVSLATNLAAGWVVTKIGEMGFSDFVRSQNSIEQQALGALNDDFEKYGYEVGDITARNLKEEVVTEANRRRILGAADADALKEKTTAIAQPIEGNSAAAWVMMAQEAGQAFVRMSESIAKAVSAFAGRS